MSAITGKFWNKLCFAVLCVAVLMGILCLQSFQKTENVGKFSCDQKPLSTEMPSDDWNVVRTPLVSTNQTPTVRGTLPFVLTSKIPFTKPLRLAVESMGARTAGVVSQNALLVEVNETTRARLAADSRLESVSEYLPEAKVQPALSALIVGGADSVEVSIISLSAADRQFVVGYLSAGGGEILTGCVNEGDTIRAKLPVGLVAELAMRGDVRWIERFERPHLINDNAVKPAAMNVRDVWNLHGLTGAGQKISTSDSGIDTGDLSTMHKDLRNRVKGMYFVNGCRRFDANGHGTHTAGSIVGDGTMSGGQYKGVAYEADLYAWFGGDENNLGVRLPASVSSLYQPDGVAAYVHSGSWGLSTGGEYISMCAEHDAYVWDNPEFLPVYGAGNDGPGASTIGSLSSAKNVLTVGASESLPGDPTTIVSFSGRGPCRDGRIKPDIVTPGQWVISARSSRCNREAYLYNPDYMQMKGTSTSCPLAAGSVLLVRQWLVERKGFADEDGRRPTAALMKAVIMGGAKDVEIPDSDKGWGRVNLEETLFPSNRAVRLVDRIPFAQDFVTNIVVETTNAAPLDVQLVWVDYPGASSGDQSVPRLVNDLDLTVMAEGFPMPYYGNGGTEPDVLNNVESVRIANAPASRYVITVRCKTILHDHTEGGAAALYIRGAFQAEPDAAWLRTETVDGVPWTFSVANGEAVVRGCPSSAVPKTTVGSIRVPSELGGLPVTVIGARAFCGCNALTDVVIPEGVVRIEEFAFSGCVGLKSVFIPKSVVCVFGDAFSGCGSVRDVTIPACVKMSRDFPASYDAITNVVVHEGVASIADSTFSGCSALRSVRIPSSVMRIGAYTFKGCAALERVHIPSGLTTLEEGVFSGCSALAEMAIPEKVMSIGDWAFSSCFSLASVTIPSSATNIGDYAFFCCSSLTNAVIPAGVTSIGQGAFRHCSALKVVSIPEGVTVVRYGTFASCFELLRVTMPDTVRSIEESAFEGCVALADVTIPSSAEEIGDWAFYDCRALGSVAIPSGVTSIGDSVFWGCRSLSEAAISEGVQRIGARAFCGCDGLTSITIPSSVADIGASAFSDCERLEVIDVDVASGAYASGDGVLYDKSFGELLVCPSAKTDVAIPSTVIRIGESAFKGCDLLTAVEIPESVLSIGEAAFSGCSALTSVTIPSGVTIMEDYTFSGCKGLASVEIPLGMTSIGYRAFSGCGAIRSVTVPGWVVCSSVFDSSYRSITNATVCAGATSIGDGAFNGCSALADVMIPPGVTQIGDRAFKNCSAIRNIEIPSSVTYIDNCAFDGCSAIRSVTAPGWVVYEDTFGFSYRDITNAMISEGATCVGEYAFYECSSLESVTIPASVTDIGDSAFSGCSSLSSVVIPANVTSIGAEAFYHCWAKLTEVTIPPSVTSIGDDAFGGCSSLRTIFVELGDADRVRDLLCQSGMDLSDVRFVELGDSSLMIAPGRLPDGNAGEAYSARLFASGGSEPYSWQVVEHASAEGYVESREENSFVAAGTAQGWRAANKCWSYPLPFAFPFCGKTHTTAYLNSNGTITFDGAFSGRAKSLGTFKSRVMIAAMWHDLTTTSGDVYVTETGDEITFRWQGAYYGNDHPVNFAVALSSDGRIRLSYGLGNVYGGLVGISAGDGKNFLVCSNSENVGLSQWHDVVMGEPDVHYGLPEGVHLSEDGVLSGVPAGASSNLVDVMVADAQGLRNHRGIAFVVWNGLPDGIYTDVVDGVEWHYRVTRGQVSVGVSEEEGAVPKTTAGALSIPPALGALPVTGIGSFAFAGCGGLTELTIPATVMHVRNNAFDGCRSICNVTIPTGVISIRNAFPDSYDRIRHVAICPGAIKIATQAFEGCSGLESVSIPSSVMSIAKDAFSDCGNLRDVTIPACVTRIYDVFPQLYDVITNVVICADVTSVGDKMFYNCSSLEAVAVPPGVTNIGDSAFFGCDNLKSVALPSSIISIGAYAFSGCSGLQSVVIPSSVTNIGYRAFQDCKAVQSVTIPACVTRLRDTFGWAYLNITNVTLCEGMTSVGANVFHGCSGVRSVTIPSSVTSIGSDVFWSCKGLMDIIFGGNAPMVAQDAFPVFAYGCRANVYRGTTGWDDDKDGMWWGMTLVYRTQGQDLLPDLGENPEQAQIAEALDGSADPQLAASITNGADYAVFRAWAETVKGSDGQAAGAQAVKDSPNAWLSFALGQNALLEAAPTESDLKVEMFTPAAETGKFDFTVSVKDVEIGSEATKKNLKRIFGLEGATSLTPDGFSPDKVDIEFADPLDGKVKFTASPRDASSGTFFMKVKMIP